MRTPALAAMAALLFLGACGGVAQSRLNPLNWFQASAPETLEPRRGWAAVEDNRALVADVTDLTVERFPGGAIVRATGLPPTQGWWDAELVPDNDFRPVDGVLSFRFVVAAPRGPARTGTPVSREVTAGIVVSNFKLAETRQITVTGASNARSSRR